MIGRLVEEMNEKETKAKCLEEKILFLDRELKEERSRSVTQKDGKKENGMKENGKMEREGGKEEGGEEEKKEVDEKVLEEKENTISELLEQLASKEFEILELKEALSGDGGLEKAAGQTAPQTARQTEGQTTGQTAPQTAGLATGQEGIGGEIEKRTFEFKAVDETGALREEVDSLKSKLREMCRSKDNCEKVVEEKNRILEENNRASAWLRGELEKLKVMV